MKFAVFLVGIAAAVGQTLPQTYIPQTHFASGQDVVPSFDGWLRNADGTFSMVFGYFNRNFEEELVIPAGPDNKVEPGMPDQGQPTYFLPRRHAWMFRVKVPADWGTNKELVWTLTSHGRTERAYASLKSDEELTERIIMTRGNLNPGLDDPNRPPVISISPVSAANVSSPVTLTAHVTDDGLPKPREPKARPAVDTGKSQTNTAARPRAGLSVTWVQYRGPAKVVFDDNTPLRVLNGAATTQARFPAPGSYILRATANDGELSVTSDVTVNVGP
ncbi:MAG: hypothetical protein JO307_07680 [Bryobacterales bacterium]|nr:hypothetical protein [Bryobacterales bacterium]MBV9402062.1 hypothetical protein [Bryobacterales bacterium]